MTVKLIEIRDRATFIPAMAIHLRNRTPREFYLLRRAGYSAEQIGCREGDYEPYVVLVKLDGCQAEYDPYAWGTRTMTGAHAHLLANWDSVSSGDVVDVEFLTGERPTPRESEETSHAD